MNKKQKKAMCQVLSNVQSKQKFIALSIYSLNSIGLNLVASRQQASSVRFFFFFISFDGADRQR